MLQVALLGEQAIIDTETGDAATRSPRSVALLAFLVAHAGVPQPRQRIAATFWPDSPDGQALTNLRRELHHLRRAVRDSPSLVVRATDLCWRDGDDVEVDARVFQLEGERARAAADRGDHDAASAHASVALPVYRGPFLPGSDDEWAATVRADLEQRCVDLCDLLVVVRGLTGDAAGASEAARRRVALRPLEEVGYRALMGLQVDLGDRAGAVRTYHRCAAILDRELGVQPDRVTRQAFERLLDDERSSARRSLGVRTPAAPLVGREAELATLTALWRHAGAGAAAVVLVRGDAGVGKTRLVDEFTRRTRCPRAAHSRCFAAAGRLPFAPIAEWLRHPAIADGARTLAPPWQVEVERLTALDPGNTDRRAQTPGGLGMADAWQRHRFVEGLARALLAGGRPTVLVLDDLQWCDPETLEFLGYLVRTFPRAPLLIAATMRGDGPDVARLIGRPSAGGPVTELVVAPLDPAATARLGDAVARRRLSDREHALLHAGTGGFPLYVVEAVRSADGHPLAADRLRDVLGARLATAGPDADTVAGLVAAAGRDVTLDLLVEAGDLEPLAVVRAVDTLWRQRILRETGRGYDFAHDLLREAAYARIDSPHRWLLHRRLAQGLALLHADDLDPFCAQLARQYDRGGRPDRAVPHYLRAAEIASATFGYDEATRLHRAALVAVRKGPASAESRRRELAVLEASAAPLTASRGYASPDLQEVLERAVDLAEQLGRRKSLVAGLVGLWSSRFVQGRNLDAERVAARALAVAEADGDADAVGAAHFACGGSAVSLAEPDAALRHFAAADDLTGGTRNLWVGARYDVHGRAWSAHALWLRNRPDDARVAAESAVALAREADQPYSLAVALAYGAITDQLRGDTDALHRTVTELRALCGRYGFAYYREWALVLDGWARSRIDLATAGVDRLRATGSFARMPYWLILLADVHARAGHIATARAIVDAALTSARTHSDLWWLPEVLRRRADLASVEDVSQDT
ncbi:ATP-binding protein [Rhodococcus sp. NPDC003318]|uniref:ATP-binding protein n=1 Tax=Rhodococcus sp. NPDC003318 TaxID=3364503 RepID=UPI0036A89EC0